MYERERERERACVRASVCVCVFNAKLEHKDTIKQKTAVCLVPVVHC